MGGVQKGQNLDYVIFEWSLIKVKKSMELLVAVIKARDALWIVFICILFILRLSPLE